MIIRHAKDTRKDCELVFSLSNDPIVRAVSFNQNRIEYDSHCRWYERTVKDKNTLFFLVFSEESEADFVGQIRFKRESEQADECVISLSITELFRGKHLAPQFLALGIQELQKNWTGIRFVTAEVKGENDASNALFSKGGFELVSKVNYYKLPLNGGGYTDRVIYSISNRESSCLKKHTMSEAA
ncbi:MAG: GNAT family N-acetyltransferase [Spirochaetales bacterium]|nr:GNAT family N-acetyltransferase [Spirochaetales bacterium]